MQIELINQINENFSPIEQILFNRGIQKEQMKHYLYPSKQDINDYRLFGQDKLSAAAKALITIIAANKTCLIIVDCDCDGYTSAALLINYLHELYPTWIENKVKWFIHDSKQHGLSDCIDFAIERQYQLVICPDASSNDYSEHRRLSNAGIPCIVLDHHEAEKVDENAIIINNQLSNYPNKDLSGVGVVYQFCRYLDHLLNIDKANHYLDLIALGLVADMMSLTSIETKYLIGQGLQNKNIENPFIYYMVQKNDYSLKYSEKGYLTSIGVAFYIAPFVNAITRSGTLEQKQLVFKSMLKFKAFEKLPSTKRGHAAGAQETLVEQAVRIVTNVKARQGKAQDAGMELLERMIDEQKLLNNKVLLFLLESGQIDRNIAGLCANKIMAKYQRPTCVLTKYELYENDESLPWDEPTGQKKIIYQGSARGYEKGGINDFKAVCSSTGVVNYAQGHANAFGISIDKDNIDDFLNKTNEILSHFSGEVSYRCDYIWEPCQINASVIMELGHWDTLWGKDIDEPMICIKNLRLTSEQVTIYSKRGNTIRINTEGISLIKFLATDKMCEELQTDGWIQINIIGKADINKWNGQEYPQIIIEDVEILDRKDSCF